MNQSRNWYIRRGKQVKGPFPEGLVIRYVLLGRVSGSDEVSHDRLEWQRLSRVPELIPDVIREAQAHPEDPEAREHLERARRWADERRAGHGDEVDVERRGEEAEDLVNHRAAREQREAARRRRNNLTGYTIVALIIALVVALPFILPSNDNGGESQCNAPPAAGVNWSNCLLEGRQFPNANLAGAQLRNTKLADGILRASNLAQADLSYGDFGGTNFRGANLSQAHLKGASLRRAELANANLSGADLSYADLRESDLAGADLTGARLDNALWVDGSTCLPGSLGGCRAR